MRGDEHVPLEACICGACFDCPDGWHWSDDELPCACTPDCALRNDSDDDVLGPESVSESESEQ